METYRGYVLTTGDVIKLFEACRLGLLPRVQRRLSEKERRQIRSGSVFVWDEREAGIRRWTDGKSWSAGRKSGSVVKYWEVESKRGDGPGSGQDLRMSYPGRRSDQSHDTTQPEGCRYKADGLLKLSIRITTLTNQRLHLISYSRPQFGQSNLQRPSSDPSLRSVLPPKGIYPESEMGETNLVSAHTLTPTHQLCGWRTSHDETPSRGEESPAFYPPHTHTLQPPRLPPVGYNGNFAHVAYDFKENLDCRPVAKKLRPIDQTCQVLDVAETRSACGVVYD